MSGFGFDVVLKQLVDQWNEMKEALYDGNVSYNDFEKLRKEYLFFNRFEDVFKSAVTILEVPLKEIKPLFRGVGEEVALDYYDRMIPNAKYIKGYNRMNPPGEAFIYLGILGKNKGRAEKTIKSHIVKTILKEVRALRSSTATICEIQVNDQSKNKIVLDFRGDKSIPKDESILNKYMEKEVHKSRGELTTLQVVNRVLSKVYFNMFSSDQIFKPVETDEQDVKKREYAPFHTLAYYVRKRGYAGIIFNSTVHKNGTNLVLFEPSDVSIIPDSMEHIQTSDFI